MALIGPFADGKFIQRDESALKELLRQNTQDRRWIEKWLKDTEDQLRLDS